MIKLLNIEYVELWVENASEVAKNYENYFGFERVAEASPKTGLDNHISIVLKQANAKLLITSAIDAKGSVYDFVLKHGDGVRDIAFAVENVEDTFKQAIASGAVAYDNNTFSSDKRCPSTIIAFGNIVHTFIEKNYLPTYFHFFPNTSIPKPDFGIRDIDHVAMCVHADELDEVAGFYKNVLGFKDGHEEYVETNYSGMNSRVVMHGAIRFSLQEPLKHNPSGPILEFLKLNCGAGVYHVALLSSNIYRTIRSLPSDVKVLDIPDTYYDQLPSRIQINEPIADLKELKILVDGDSSGYLMQMFTRSFHKRRTLYVEIIQRISHDGFGSGNIRALFDAIETDQIKMNKEPRGVCSEAG